MTKEEMLTWIGTGDGAKWLEGIPANQVGMYIGPDAVTAQIDEAKRPILAKNTELMDEVKRVKEARTSLTEEKSAMERYTHLLEDFSIGVDESGKLDYTKVEDALRSIKAGKNPDVGGASPEELVELNRKLKQSLRDLELKDKELARKETEYNALTGDVTSRDQYIQDLLISQNLRAALGKKGYPEMVIDNLLPSLITKSGAQVVYNEEQENINKRWSAITDDNRTMEDWVEYWSQTEEGQFFMPGRKNFGGGAGGGGKGGNKTFAEMSLEERTELWRSDRATYDAMKGASK